MHEKAACSSAALSVTSLVLGSRPADCCKERGQKKTEIMLYFIMYVVCLKKQPHRRNPIQFLKSWLAVYMSCMNFRRVALSNYYTVHNSLALEPTNIGILVF